MSEPKTTGALVTAEVTWVSPVEYVEIRAALARSRAREKRLEERVAKLEEVLRGVRESIAIARQVLPETTTARGCFEGAFLGVPVKVDAALSEEP